jgi:hypothetical protein
MDKTDLSLILSSLGVLLALNLGLVAVAVLAALLIGILIGRATRHDP